MTTCTATLLSGGDVVSFHVEDERWWVVWNFCYFFPLMRPFRRLYLSIVDGVAGNAISPCVGLRSFPSMVGEEKRNNYEVVAALGLRHGVLNACFANELFLQTWRLRITGS